MKAVGVIVPARDEEDGIGACLRSVRLALDALPAGVETAVAVVLDRCTDRTPEEARAALPSALLLRVAALGGRSAPARGPGPARMVAGTGVGALRELGVGAVLDVLRGDARRTWLLHTDADTVVPPDWVLTQLRHAAHGAAAVAGLAELDDPATLPVAAHHGYRAILGVPRTGHRHVYGANLGVRADAHLAVGGFPVDGSGEDHGLWDRLRAAGHPVASVIDGAVRTSARLDGRARGGLADLLAGLVEPGVQPGV